MNVGLSDFIIYNELHARVCAAAAVFLTQLLAFSQNDMTAFDTNAIYDGYLNTNKVVPNDSGLLCWYLGFLFYIIMKNCLFSSFACQSKTEAKGLLQFVQLHVFCVQTECIVVGSSAVF